MGSNDAQREALAKIRTQIWEFYAELKAYKQSPGHEKTAELQERFDQIFTTHTCYEALNQALKRIHKNKPELLIVLERPDVPLHNNTSETDIRLPSSPMSAKLTGGINTVHFYTYSFAFFGSIV